MECSGDYYHCECRDCIKRNVIFSLDMDPVSPITRTVTESGEILLFQGTRFMGKRYGVSASFRPDEIAITDLYTLYDDDAEIEITRLDS